MKKRRAERHRRGDEGGQKHAERDKAAPAPAFQLAVAAKANSKSGESCMPVSIPHILSRPRLRGRGRQDRPYSVHRPSLRLPRPTSAATSKPPSARTRRRRWRGPKTYGPPRRQVVFGAGINSLHKRIRPFGYAVGQDGDPRVPVLINFPASSAPFF